MSLTGSMSTAEWELAVRLLDGRVLFTGTPSQLYWP